MAQVNAQGLKAVAGQTSIKQPEMFVATYDFAVDGGSTSDEYVLMTSSAAGIVKLVGVIVETALTSGGSATLTVGIDTVGSQNQLMNAVAYTSVTGHYAVNAAIGYAAGAKVVLNIGTAALTAGKMHFVFEVNCLDLY